MPFSNLRREVKFALSGADLGKLRTILDVNCRRVRYRGNTSRVTSLYFDDVRLSACHDNLDGAPRRSKVRLRWYDAPSPQERAFMEVKRREGQATGKERLAVELAAPLETSPLHRLALGLSRDLSEYFREALLARSEPVVVVEYERAYYEAEGLRVTLDTGLVFYRQVGRRFLDRRFGVRLPGLVIVEGKAPVGSEHRLTSLLHPLSPRITRSSKYVMACQALGLIPTSRSTR